MGNTVDDIKNEFKKFSSGYGPQTIITGVVKAINADDTVKVALESGIEIEDARLRAVVASGNKALLVPAIESHVLMGRIENSDEYVVLVVSEVSEIKYVLDEVEMSVTDAGFLLKKQNDTLKQIATLIIEAIEPIIVLQGRNPDLAKLAQAKNKVNNLLR